MKHKISLYHKASGSITIFLSLTLLIIISLLFTIIEGARISTAKVYAERALSTAMDSVLAEYYGPLWKEYHIFGYDSGTGTASYRKKGIEDKLRSYLSYTFDPNRELDKSSFQKGINLLEPILDSVELKSQATFMDYNAKLLINEAVEYSKYSAIGNGIEALLDKYSLLEAPKKLSVVYDKKQKAEEELVTIDVELLRLMRLLDGIKTGKKGLKTKRDGCLQIESYFVKKICYQEPSKETVGINHDEVFQNLSQEYINPSEYFEVILNHIASLELLLTNIRETEASRDNAVNNLKELQENLMDLQGSEDDSEEKRERIDNLKEEIQSVEDRLRDYDISLSRLKEEQEQTITMIKTKDDTLNLLLRKIIPLIDEAKSSIGQILQKAKAVEPLIIEFEEALAGEREGLSTEINNELKKDLENLKRYTSGVEASYPFREMLEILNMNLSSLRQTQVYCSSGRGWATGESQSVDNYQSAKNCYLTASGYLSGYQIRGLTMDYSTLVLDRSNSPDPLTKVNELFASGISSLVIDPAIISDKHLASLLLPSEEAAFAKEDKDILSTITDFFKNTTFGDESSSMGSMFNDLAIGSDVRSKIGQGINIIAEHFLYQEYIKEHFDTYSAEKEKLNDRKPSVLAYESEYLLVGKRSDEGNLNSVIQRLLLLRLICNLVTILGDKDKVSEAKAAAAVLVGFTGLPILVSITQTILLVIWSFAEALLDLSSFLMGNAVPIIKKQITLQLPELFMLSRNYLQTKASKLAKPTEPSLTYEEYLQVFLLMTKKEDIAYRTMDLMQENLRIRYNTEGFEIKNCLYGLNTKVYIHVKPKLTGINYIQRYLGSKGKNYNLTAETGYSY